MKKTVLMILGVVMLSIMFPLSAQADVGPKPSVVIDFNGLDDEIYYATLLARQKSTGPYSVLDQDNQHYSPYQEDHENYAVFRKFVEYQDEDGFYFLQYFAECSQTNCFSWTYYPPREFKLLLYFPGDDVFVISPESYERYAFDSYFTANITEASLGLTTAAEISLTKSYNYSYEVFSLMVRILLTLAIELGIALLFGLRGKRVFRLIVIINLVTQIALNLALNSINYYMGSMAFVIFYVLLEIAVLTLESILYVTFLKKEASKLKLMGYAFFANAASFSLGMLLAVKLPGIF